MVLVKRIAAAAGLGGASSDAAAALVAANLAWGVDWPRGRLSELAAELGSDVPFFLGSTAAAICRGRGERVEPVGGFGGLHFVVVSPADGLATAPVYQRSGPAARPRSVQPVLQEASRQGPAGLGRMLFNRLQAAASQMSPSISVLCDQFARLDLLGHQMSGSGTSYFGICRHARQARIAAALLSARGLGSVFHAASCPATCHVLRLSHQA
jgi:4-diphosphocytidyl-2-C-methyl-D-erythritol kinase